MTYSADGFHGALQACEDAGVTEDRCRIECAIDLLRGSTTAVRDALARQEVVREHDRILALRRPAAELACREAGVIREPYLEHCIYELSVVSPDPERDWYQRGRAIARALQLQARERGFVSTLTRWQNAIAAPPDGLGASPSGLGAPPSNAGAPLPVSGTIVLRAVAVSIDGALPPSVE